MEYNRLKDFPSFDGHNEEVFVQIYEETKPLRDAVKSQVKPSLFGVSQEDIASMISSKFMQVYQKYCLEFEDDPQLLKAHILSALQLFKRRLLVSSQQKQYQIIQNWISSVKDSSGKDVDIFSILPLDEEPPTDPDYEDKRDLVTQFMKKHLSDTEFLVFQCDINPPPYILRLMASKKKITAPSLWMIVEFIDDPKVDERAVKCARRRIKRITENASAHFHRHYPELCS